MSRDLGRFTRTRHTSEPVGAETMAQDAAGEPGFTSAVLDALLGYLPQAFAVLDLETRIVRISTLFATRFAATDAELVGRPLGEVLPAVAEVLAGVRERVLVGGESLRDIALSGTGGARWSSDWHPVRDLTQRVVGFALLLTPVPERVETGSSAHAPNLDAAQQRGTELKQDVVLRLALQCANAGIWQTDLLTGENTWGEGMAEMLGVPAERAAIESRRWPGYVYEGDKERIQQEFLGLYEREPGRPWSIDYRAYRLDGALRWFSSRAVVFNEPEGGPKLIGMTQDITERKQVERALEESESTLRSFYESSPLLMGVVEVSKDDSDIIHVYDSPATARFFERWPESAADASARQLGAPPEVIQRWVASYRESERTTLPVRFEYVHESAHGKVWLSCVVAFIGLAPSGRSRFSYVAADITEQKATEQALRETDRRKNEFLATLAHELRSPLAPIRNAVHLLRQEHGSEAARRAWTMIDRQVSHMVRLIDDLLDIGRISSGKLELRRERVELATVLDQAIETALPHMSGRSFHSSLPAESIFLDADPVRIAQLFSNLLNNACKYSDAGGNIWLEVERAEGEVLVRVRDDGIGIAPEHLSGLFEMFSQVAPALSRSQGGLGIGLSLVRGLVEMHGGSVSVRSEGLGRGSELTVRLPILDSTSAALSLAEEGAPARTEVSRRVLVVEDNHDIAESLVILLELDGNVVEMAQDGIEAVEKSQSFRPELILLDLGLPRLNGYDTCRAIREQAWADNVVIAALTGWGQEEDRDRSKQAGFDLHLVKPLAPEALFRLLRDLETHRPRTP